MKITIIPSDGAVYIDGYCLSNLDLIQVPTNVHAFQWNGTKGFIEFVEDNNFCKPPNQILDELPDWVASALQKWQEAKILEDLVIEQKRQNEIIRQAVQAEAEASLAQTTN